MTGRQYILMKPANAPVQEIIVPIFWYQIANESGTKVIAKFIKIRCLCVTILFWKKRLRRCVRMNKFNIGYVEKISMNTHSLTKKAIALWYPNILRQFYSIRPE